MISEKKRLQIANVCYANVSGMFATFCNLKFRGPNFTWDFFVKYCGDESDLWLAINNIQRTEENKELAKKFAIEIAENLISKLNA